MCQESVAGVVWRARIEAEIRDVISGEQHHTVELQVDARTQVPVDVPRLVAAGCPGRENHTRFSKKIETRILTLPVEQAGRTQHQRRHELEIDGIVGVVIIVIPKKAVVV